MKKISLEDRYFDSRGNLFNQETLKDEMEKAASENDFIKAVLVQMTFIEVILRIKIANILPPEKNFYKYSFNERILLGNLISYLEILQITPGLLIQKLREYNKMRRKLAHDATSLNSIKEYKNKCKEMHDLGSIILLDIAII